MPKNQAPLPLDAFNYCPNKTLRAVPDPGADLRYSQDLEVVCVQFPFGSCDIVTVSALCVGIDAHRERFARHLGCATCRFNNEPMDRVDIQSVRPDGALGIETRFTPHSTGT